MLPLQHRLKHDRDFTRLFRKGRFFPGRGIGMRVVRNDLPASRFAFVVGTKVSKKAVVRNLLKRRMRAAVAKRLTSILPGFDIAFLASSGSARFEYSDVREAVERHLRLGHLLIL